MLFLFPPKFNDDFVFQDDTNVMEVEAGAVTTYLTWEAMKAAAVAAGSAVAPVAVGVVGAAAIGWVVDETIGWDVVADYGQGIINHVLSLGGTVDEIYDAETDTVSLTNEFVTGAAHAVDSIPDTNIVDYGEWLALPAIAFSNGVANSRGYDVNIYSNSSSDRIIIRGDYSIYGGNELANSYAWANIRGMYADSGRYSAKIKERFIEVPKLMSKSGEFEVIGSLRTGETLEKIRFEMNTYYGKSISLNNVRYAHIPNATAIPADVITEDLTAVKDSFPTTVEDRKELMTNTIGGIGAIALEDAQAVTGVTFAEMASATTAEDLDESTANDLGILGVLTGIYNFVKSLPVRIVGAFTSLFNTIINAILAIPDVITSGVDNLLINVNALGNTIAGSLDDLLIDVNSLGNSLWGSLDELLIDVNSLANSLATSFGGLLINLGTWFDSLVNGIGTLTGSVTGAITDAMSGLLSGVGSITGSISDAIADALSGLLSGLALGLDTLIGLLNDIWSWITGLAEWLIALVVPTSLAVLQPSITSLTNTFNQKFEFIILPIKNFGNAYSESKSLYDVTFKLKYKDVVKDVHVLPIAFKPAVDVFRFVANGVVVVLTYISMYNRFRKEVIAV